ncbi:MAG: sensor histidine kinase [Bacteroidota bacterium]
MNEAFIIGISLAYLFLLFAIAYWMDRRSRSGKSITNNPYVYGLSLAIYCTAWTFYGSVGKAASSGLEFLPIYLGPTIMACLWWFVLRKMIYISKSQRIASIADFISARYGKSTFLGILVTLIATFCIVPYISIQLKAVALSYDLLKYSGTQAWSAEEILKIPFYKDTAWYITIILALFTILFGTRKLDPNERHDGLVAAVVFESVFKLIAFLAIGIFVTFGIFKGFADIFEQAAAKPEIMDAIFIAQDTSSGWNWFWLVLISMLASLLLPRQFHIAVVENYKVDHIRTASWIFPLYLFLINLFVLPIAVGGILKFGSNFNAEMFVLSLPLLENKEALALFVAIGGFSASTSMVIVAITALGIMISNNLVLPFLLNSSTIKGKTELDISGRLLAIRRLSVIVVLVLAYGYFRFVSAKYTIVSIGLISFAGVAQFAPALLGGMYWKKATKAGAVASLLVGFSIWFFCLPLPTLAEVGLLSENFIQDGLFGISWLNAYHLFGADGMSSIAHGTFWSLLLNVLTYVGVSIYTRQSALEITQADLFVDIYKYRTGSRDYEVIRRKAKVKEIRKLLSRILGAQKTEQLLDQYARQRQIDWAKVAVADEDLVSFAETNLAGAVGAASAKTILNSIVKVDPISLEEMFTILEQTQEIVKYSKQLEEKSTALQITTNQLQAANEQLKALDALKADFISTITHELRTPITSIKALAKILKDNPSLAQQQQDEYLGIVVDESERITRLVNQVLDAEKMKRTNMEEKMKILDFSSLLKVTYASLIPLMEKNNIRHQLVLPKEVIEVKGMSDQLQQAIVNLLSNAIKFCDSTQGTIRVELKKQAQKAILSIQDNGIGIAKKDQAFIFDKFAQVTDNELGKPKGTGLGLAITKEIVELHQGEIYLKSDKNNGANFTIVLPVFAQ